MNLRASHIYLLSLLALLTGADSALAVPAAPGTHVLKQADGSTIKARQWGDEWQHGWETVSGYSILFDAQQATWVYADRNAFGQLIPSATAVRAEETSDAALKGKLFTPQYPSGREITRHLRPTGEAKASARQKAALSAGGARDTRQKTVPPSGTGRLPVLMINFNDTSSTYSAADFDTLLFSGTSGFTLKNYYEEISYSKFTLNGTVSNWSTAAHTHDYYGQNDGNGEDMYPAALVEEAVMAADPGTDFAQYDTDGDCYADVVAVIHQGSGEEAGGPASDIWSSRWNLNQAVQFGAGSSGEYTTNDPCPGGGFIKVNDYILQAETLNGGQQTIGVFAHEYGHSLGLPDLYDTDNTSSGLGRWALMAGGSWNQQNRKGDRPAHMTAWSKYFLGWVNPTPVTGAMTAEPIDAASAAADVYQAGTGSPVTATGEYFLIENRHRSGFDTGLPGSGLAVWHVDESKASTSNSDNADECVPPADCSSTHYRVALVQADNRWDLENKNNRGDNGDLFSNTAAGLSHNTAPSSDLYAGIASNFSATNISASGPRMSVDLSTASSSSGVFGFREAAISVGEGAGSVSIAISRTGGNAGAVSVLCSTSNGSALAGKDFSSRSTRLNWPAGDSSDRNCTVPILDDSIIEGRQLFTVTLSSATGGAVLGTPDTLAVTIRDDETCSGDSVQLNSIAFETGADVDCLATTSIQATGSAVSTGSRVGFFAPGVTLGPDFAVSGTLTVGTFEETDSSNTTPLTGSSAAAPFNPYPSIIALSGISGSIHRMTVTLMGVNHTWPSDMEAILIGPQGQNVLLMSNAGGDTAINGIDLTFDDDATGPVPSPMVSGTYLPTSLGSTAFPAPVPAPPYGAGMSALTGSNPNGEWKLYLFDDLGGDVGSISGGWRLHVETH